MQGMVWTVKGMVHSMAFAEVGGSGDGYGA